MYDILNITLLVIKQSSLIPKDLVNVITMSRNKRWVNIS